MIERPGAVAVPAIDDRAGVDRDDLALAELPVARDAVDDLVVDRDADAGRERVARIDPGVALERGDRADRPDVGLGDGVQLGRGDARPQLGLDQVEHLGDDPAGPAHPLDLRAGLAGDHQAAPTSPRASSASSRRRDLVDRSQPVDRAQHAGRPVVVDDVEQRRDLLGTSAPGRSLRCRPRAGPAANRRGRRRRRRPAGSRPGCRRGRWPRRSGDSPCGRPGRPSARRCRARDPPGCRAAPAPGRAPQPGRGSAESRRARRRRSRRRPRGARGRCRRWCRRARAGRGSCTGRRRGRAACPRRRRRAAGRRTPGPARRGARPGSAPGSPSRHPARRGGRGRSLELGRAAHGESSRRRRRGRAASAPRGA